MKKTKNRNYYRSFALGTVGTMLLLGGAFVLVPELDNSSYAVTCTDGTTEDDYICDTADTTVNVELDEVLDIASFTISDADGTTKYCDDAATCSGKGLDDAKANLGHVTPGALSTTDVKVTVDTNAPSGYQLQINGVKTVTEATAAAATDLVRTEGVTVSGSTVYPTISTLSAADISGGNNTATNFAAGKWGYMITTTGTGSSGTIPADTAYSAIPASATSVRNYTWQTVSGSSTLTTDTTFRFGVKPAANQAAGTYEGSVLFTVVSNTVKSGS